MPAKSAKQARFMRLCANAPGKATKKCPPKRVAREFVYTRGSMDLGIGLATGAMAAGGLLAGAVITGAVEGPVADGINAISPLWEHSPALAAMVLTVGGFLAFLWKVAKLLQAERTAADLREEARELRTLDAFEKMHASQVEVQSRVAAALEGLKTQVQAGAGCG